MAHSLNRVCLIGRLGRDPEFRSMQGGDQFCNLSLATTDVWKDRVSGERRERTEWHNIVIFNEHLVEIAEKYLRKGSRVYIEGSLQTRKYKSKSGEDHSITEIALTRYRGELVMLDGRGGMPTTDVYSEAAVAATAETGRDVGDGIPF